MSTLGNIFRGGAEGGYLKLFVGVHGLLNKIPGCLHINWHHGVGPLLASVHPLHTLPQTAIEHSHLLHIRHGLLGHPTCFLPARMHVLGEFQNCMSEIS